MLKIVFEPPLNPSTGHLRINFSGSVSPANENGLYWCPQNVSSASQTAAPEESFNALVSSLEPASARRVFPCWDEPGFQATFEICLIVPKGLTVVSNMVSSAQARLFMLALASISILSVSSLKRPSIPTALKSLSTSLSSCAVHQCPATSFAFAWENLNFSGAHLAKRTLFSVSLWNMDRGSLPRSLWNSRQKCCPFLQNTSRFHFHYPSWT